MKITGITAQQRDKNRVNVMVEGKFRFSLDIFQVGELGIRVGREYSDAELTEMETESQFGKLYARSLEYSLMRPHSVKELKDYLYKKTMARRYKDKRTGELKEREGVSATVTQRVLERLIEKGYVDDEKFTRFWVENRNQRKGSSMRKLRSELAAKGVDSAIVERCIAVTERNDHTELSKIIDKKRQRYPDPQKLMQYLARQGFSYEDIKAALAAEPEEA